MTARTGEYFDVLTKEGERTGIRKLRAQVHADGDWHRSVHVWILDVRRRQLLVQLRAKDKDSYPDCWDVSCAGHLTAGDSSVDAALRELEEELGLRMERKDLVFFGSLAISVSLKGGTFLDNEHSDIYLVTRPVELSALRFADGEVQEAKYMDVDELEERVARKDPVFTAFYSEDYRRFFEFVRAQCDAAAAGATAGSCCPASTFASAAETGLRAEVAAAAAADAASTGRDEKVSTASR